MTDAPGILQYSPPAEVSKELQLRAGNNGSIRVTFGMLPLWIEVVVIGVCGLTAVVNAAVAIALPVMLAQLIGPPLNGPSTERDIWLSFAMLSAVRLLAALIWSVPAGLSLYRLWKWERVPRRIIATPSGMIVSEMGWLRPRHRFWAADRITAVELKRWSGSLSKRTVATLTIRCRKWIPLYFRLSSMDSQLPRHIAERLADVVGCSLKIN